MIEIVTPPTGAAVTAAELRAWMRLNTATEDAILDDLIASAADLFETEASRPVLATGYRQYLERWPAAVCLGRGGATAIAGVYAYAADGSAAAIPASAWSGDLHGTPNRIRFAAPPPIPNGLSGLAVAPVGYVDFSAGWANAAAVPKPVIVAIKQLSAHWYQHREAFTEKSLGPLQRGWVAIVMKYKLGLIGPWERQLAPFERPLYPWMN